MSIQSGSKRVVGREEVEIIEVNHSRSDKVKSLSTNLFLLSSASTSLLLILEQKYYSSSNYLITHSITFFFPLFQSFYSETCSQNLNNKTVIITNLYEGIPQTLILNLIAWVFLILLFTLLRQQAWDYGRLALVNSITGKKWTQIFYAHGNNEEILHSLSNEMIAPVGSPDAETGTSEHVRMHRQHSVADSGFFSWIVATWKLRRDQILRHSGPDVSIL